MTKSSLRKKKKIVIVNDTMQRNYLYELSAPVGRNFRVDFRPELSPKQMLELGVFGGRYLRDCQAEFPPAWFKKAKLFPDGRAGHDRNLNFFGVNASQSLAIWREKGWINKDNDPRGWFQWYCRYYLGRRLPSEDDRQIKRWLAIKRHIAQVQKNCRRGDFNCRPRQRQALLHWAYDSRKI